MSEEVYVKITREELRKMIIEGVKNHLKECSRGIPSPKDPYLTREDVSSLFGVSVKTIDTWSKSGHLKKKRIGGKIYFLRSEIEEKL